MPQGAPSLDLIREEAGLKGTKCGCREGDCGACTVLLGTPTEGGVSYRAVNSCILPVGRLEGKHLVTLEGVTPPEGSTLLQEIFVRMGASQCGFCTPGMIMSISGYLLSRNRPDVQEAIDSLGGNICRCTGYMAVLRAVGEIVLAAGTSPADDPESHEHRLHLAKLGIIPDWLCHAEALLQNLTVDDEMMDGKAIPVGGGTDLMVGSGKNIREARLHFLSDDPKLGTISLDDESVIIGAAVTMSQLLGSDRLECIADLRDSLVMMGSNQIRNVATVGGNIVNASPIGDLTIMLLALEAELEITGTDGSRRLKLRDFYRGYKDVDLNEGEILSRIIFRRPAPGCLMNFEKVSMRQHLDIASVNTAAVVAMEDGIITEASVSAGGVAPVPLYLEGTSKSMLGSEICRKTALETARMAESEIRPIDDVRGSADYKRTLLGRLIIAHFHKFSPDRDWEVIL
jgi:xanthine dehydrogenase small subunit